MSKQEWLCHHKADNSTVYYQKDKISSLMISDGTDPKTSVVSIHYTSGRDGTFIIDKVNDPSELPWVTF